MQHRLGSHRCNLRKENGFVLYPTMQNWLYDEEYWQTVLTFWRLTSTIVDVPHL